MASTPSPWTYRAGVNTVGSLDRLDELKRAGFSLVRLPTTWDRAQKSPEGPIEVPRDLVHQVDVLARAGMAIVLDAHQSQWSKAFFTPAVGLPRWLYPQAKPDSERGGSERDQAKRAFLENRSSFGGPVDPQGRWIAWLEALAETFAEEPAVVAVDLMNEPGYGGGAEGLPPSLLADFYERAARAIRQYRRGWPVVVENGTWGNLENGTAPFKAPEDWPAIHRGMIGSVHFYPSPPRLGESSDAKANRLLGVLEAERATLAELGAPLYVGELAAFGATDSGDGDHDLHWKDWPRQTRKLARWLAENDVAWSYWAWQTGAGPTLSDAKTGGLRRDVLDALAPAL